MVDHRFKLLSVIIPVYKQAKTIKLNLQAIIAELEISAMPYEVIVVVDGFADKSFEEAKKSENKKLQVYGYEENKGKGYAVRYGMVRAKGDVVAFIDAGGEIRESGIPMLLEHMRWYNADIIVGSKRHSASKISYPPSRKLFSLGYQLLTRLLFGLNVRDTQVGLKVYKRKVLEDVLPRLTHDHFSFDIELLVVAYYLGYTRIYESPIELDFSKISSTIQSGNAYQVILKMLLDTINVFIKLRFLSYYDIKNKKLWHNNPDVTFVKSR